jgi:hypothetical protein
MANDDIYEGVGIQSLRFTEMGSYEEFSMLANSLADRLSDKTPGQINYKYAEDKIISDFKAYIDKTYGEHYKSETKEVECFDAWIALGDSTPTFRNTAIKYLWRFGKKNGSSKADLMKALHYTLMCLYVDHYKDFK